MCGGFGDSIYFSVDYNDKYEFSIVNKTPTCDFSCPTTMAGTPSIANASNNIRKFEFKFKPYKKINGIWYDKDGLDPRGNPPPKGKA